MNPYHLILGCQPNSSPEELRKAWRNKCREYHPDRGGDPNMFIKVMHAYKMLTDSSYQFKHRTDQVKDLTFTIQMAINFLEAFFGSKIVFNYNRIYLDSAFEQIVSDTVEPISLTIDIPAGCTNGLELTLKSQGMVCGDQIGDAVVKVKVRKHPRYTVKDIDVYCNEQIPLEIMLKGGEISIETLWGIKTVWVPPGTMPGDKVRIYNCGVNKKGYQYCTIEPKFPDQNELKGDAWKGLNINWEQAENKNKEDEELNDVYDNLVKGVAHG